MSEPSELMAHAGWYVAPALLVALVVFRLTRSIVRTLVWIGLVGGSVATAVQIVNARFHLGWSVAEVSQNTSLVILAGVALIGAYQFRVFILRRRTNRGE